MGGGGSKADAPPTDEEFQRKIKATGSDGYLLFRQRVAEMNARTFTHLSAAAVPSSKYTLFLKYEQQYLAEEKAVLSAMASGGSATAPVAPSDNNPLADEARAMLTQLELPTTDPKVLLDDEWWCFLAKNTINTRNELRFYDSHEENGEDEQHRLLAQSLWLFEEDARSRALDLSGVENRRPLQPIAAPDNFYNTDPFHINPRHSRNHFIYRIALETTGKLKLRNGTFAETLAHDTLWRRETDIVIRRTYDVVVLLDRSGVSEEARDQFVREHSVFYQLTQSMKRYDKEVDDRTQQLVAVHDNAAIPKYLVAKRRQTRSATVASFLRGLLPKGQRDPNDSTDPLLQLAEEVSKIYRLKVTASELMEDGKWNLAARDLLNTTDQLLDYLEKFGIPTRLLTELQELVVELYEAESRANERALEIDKPKEPEPEPESPVDILLPARRPGSYYLNQRRSTGGSSTSSSPPTSPISARDESLSMDSFVTRMASHLGMTVLELRKDKTWMRLATQYLDSVNAYPFKGTPAAKKMELKRLRHLFTLLAQRANRKDMLVIIF
jgi:hypothetical protein